VLPLCDLIGGLSPAESGKRTSSSQYPHDGRFRRLTYVPALDDPHRFPKSREVGCFLGLWPGRRDSGESQPEMNIGKEGDRYLRTMLVQGAHYILGPLEQAVINGVGQVTATKSWPPFPSREENRGRLPGSSTYWVN
jgi:hypothetical protein